MSENTKKVEEVPVEKPVVLIKEYRTISKGLRAGMGGAGGGVQKESRVTVWDGTTPFPAGAVTVPANTPLHGWTKEG